MGGSNLQQLRQLVMDSKRLRTGSSSKHRPPPVVQLLLLTINSTLHMVNLRHLNNHLPYKQGVMLAGSTAVRLSSVNMKDNVKVLRDVWNLLMCCYKMILLRTSHSNKKK